MVLAQVAGTGTWITVAGRAARRTVLAGVKGAIFMAFSVTKSRPLRGLGLYRSSGKHAAPKSEVPAQRRSPEESARPKQPYQGLHKASGPRLSGPYEKKAA
jgi:hypothetical protein